VILWDANPSQEVPALLAHGDRVRGVTFSPDGMRIYSKSNNEQFIWDANNGDRIPGGKWDPPEEKNLVSPDGRWLASSDAEDVAVIDLQFKSLKVEEGFRIAKASVDIPWHHARADETYRAKQWYAATFHNAWLMRTKPNQAKYFDDLHRAYDNLKRQYSEKARDVVLPSVVSAALALPRGNLLPELTAKQAQIFNSQVWERVVTADAFKRTPLTESELLRFRDLIRQFPEGVYYNTLGTAEYRAGNFEEAISAALKSIELTPQQDQSTEAPYPGDFAILAMSHFKLGDTKTAAEYRQKMEAGVSLDAYKGDGECKSFAAEVNAVFAQ
jgi:tetratricopeptide (TPR) repeat protein